MGTLPENVTLFWNRQVPILSVKFCVELTRQPAMVVAPWSLTPACGFGVFPVQLLWVLLKGGHNVQVLLWRNRLAWHWFTAHKFDTVLLVQVLGDTHEPETIPVIVAQLEHDVAPAALVVCPAPHATHPVLASLLREPWAHGVHAVAPAAALN